MTKYEYMANQLNDENSNLNILKMIARTKELQMFKKYQIDACFLEWWGGGGGKMNHFFQFLFSLVAKFLTL
jgi:hypothetical protein